MLKHKLTGNRTSDCIPERWSKTSYRLHSTKFKTWLLTESTSRADFHKRQQTLFRVLIKNGKLNWEVFCWNHKHHCVHKSINCRVKTIKTKRKNRSNLTRISIKAHSFVHQRGSTFSRNMRSFKRKDNSTRWSLKQWQVPTMERAEWIFSLKWHQLIWRKWMPRRIWQGWRNGHLWRFITSVRSRKGFF